jgi:mannose-6-phosphate isomerase
MQPLQFYPLIKRALWGGRQLETALGKPLGPGNDYAESWELADLPGDVSVVSAGEFRGRTLRDLLLEYPREILGKQVGRPRFPLLIKYLDACQRLSIQVHPSREMALRHPEVTTGKAETWVILSAVPGAKVYAGLKPGVDRELLTARVASPAIVECLHSYEVRPGDCISLLPGTVHAIGEGLLLAEVQEPNNVTYRLSDWGRVDVAGQPRELHLELALAATNFELGPVNPVVPIPLNASGSQQRLVHDEHFVLHRYLGADTVQIPADDRPHVLMVLEGSLIVSTSTEELVLQRGQTILLPADRPPTRLFSSGDAIILDAWVDEGFSRDV